MGVYSLPFRREEQIDVCQKLANVSSLNYNEKNNSQRIQRAWLDFRPS